MMKKSVVALGILALLCAMASPLHAGGVINKSNLSADYFRSLTRNASTDAADIIAYNPAGVMKMENGFYTKLDVLYISKDYGNKVPGAPLFPIPGGSGDLESEEPSVVPGFFNVYKRDKWAGFFAVTVPGGGGEVNYDEGNARTSILAAGFITNPAFGGAYVGVDSAELEANSYAIGFTLGGAYEINSKVAVAGGLRYIDARQEFKGNVDLTNLAPGVLPDVYEVDLERTATGLGYFVGLNLAPTEKFNLGFLYQSNTELDYESDVSKDNSPGAAITTNVGWADGTKEREDLPGIIGAGLSYAFTPKVRGEVAYTRYLESDAELENARFDDPGDSWEAAVSLTYIFNPQWRGSVGFMHTDIVGMSEEDLLPEAAELDADTLGLGAVFSPTERFDVSLGFTHVMYDAETTKVQSTRAPLGTKLEKRVWAFSLGLQYRF